MQSANFNVLNQLIYLICVSVFALIHRLHSYLSVPPSALMLLFYIIGRLLVSPSSPRRMQFFQKQLLFTLLKVACMEAA